MPPKSIKSAPLKKSNSAYLSAISVSITSTAISIVNKFATRDFPFSTALSLLQTSVTLLGVFFLLLIQRSTSKLSFSTAKTFLPTALFTTVSYITNFQALKYLNVSTITIIHNVDIILIAFFDYIIFGRRFKPKTIFSLFLLLVGAVMYCYREFQVDFIGYMWLFGHILAHESHSLYTKYVCNTHALSPVVVTFYNSVFAWPMMFLSFYVSGTTKKSIEALQTTQATWAYVSAFLSLVLTILRNTTIQTLTSTAYALLNIVNKIPASIVSIFFFNQKVHPPQIVGYSLALLGGFMYNIVSKEDTFDEARAIAKKPKANKKR